MKTLKEVFGLSLVLLLLGGALNTTYAQYKKELQYYRPMDESGIYTFTPNKQQKGYKYTGFKVYVGAGLTQQWQDLVQSSNGIDASSGKPYSSVLTPIGPGFNLPTANLYLDAQLAKGMRLHLTSFLSSRHHNDTWVKGGYLRIDALPMLHNPLVNALFQHVTLKIGDMEINYGDTHFFRTDNANALYNDLVGNYLMDSFTTMDGGEGYFFDHGVIAMLGLAGGQAGEHPSVANPDQRRMAIYGKLGYDHRVNSKVRVRLTGSFFHDNRNQALYSGDRAGARYYNVMADAIPGYGRGGEGDPWSGRVTPDFSNGFTSFMINPYLQVGNLHLFGVIETTTEMKTQHNVQQYAINARYFLSKTIYVAGRYNVVHGYMSAAGAKASSNETVNRIQVGAGWFMTKNVLAKVEYMSQNYHHFTTNSVYNGGQFHGLMLEAAIGF